jgi:hypothetical protein
MEHQLVGQLRALQVRYTVSVATVGTYTFTITDSNAAVCETTNAVDVTTPATPAFTTFTECYV